MSKIDIAEALSLASQYFPDGPEVLAERLGLVVKCLPLGRLDGWCVCRRGKSAIIRINSESPEVRRRFTLAHELAHLILGTSPDIVGDCLNPKGRPRQGEQAANALASELLIPGEHLKRLVDRLPIDGKALKFIASESRVSEIAAARRISNCCDMLGLIGAGVIEFVDGEFSSNWSELRDLSPDIATRLMRGAQRTSPSPYRELRKDGTMYACITIDWNQKFSYLLIQVTDANTGSQESKGEAIRELERLIFEADPSFRNRLNGCIGYFKPIAASMPLADAVSLFYERYSERWSGGCAERMNSATGRRYVQMRLSDYAARHSV